MCPVGCQLFPLITSGVPVSTPVRLHAVVTKTNTLSFTPAPDLTVLNRLLAASNLEFEFDPKRDIERAPTQHDSNEALVARAARYHGKLVIFYTARDGGEGLANCVRMPRDNNTPFLAHEIGHYLGLPHTFRHGVGTNLAPAAETPKGLNPLRQAIKTAIESRDDARVVVVNPKTGEDRPGRLKNPIPPEVVAHGNDVIARFMDGDNPPIADTAASIHSITDAESKQVDDDRFTLPVSLTFSNGQDVTYSFAPDRTNVMSYFFGSRHCTGLSQKQGKIAEVQVLSGRRRHLLGARIRWDNWTEVEGNGRTDAAPAAATLGDRLFCFVKGNGGPKIFVNEGRVTGPFGGWKEVEGDGATNAAPAAAALSNHVFCFVKGDGSPRIFVNSRFGGGAFGVWDELGGEGATNAAPAAAALGARTFCFVKGDGSARIFVNGAFIGQQFAQWSELEGRGETDAAPAATALGDRLFCFVKGNGSPRIFVNSARVRLERREPFGGWSELAGDGETDSSPAAAALQNRVFCFVKGNGGLSVFYNAAEIGEPFSGWLEVPGGVQTDVAPAVAASNERLHVFIKEAGSNRILRTTGLLI